jgi:hypothetical protein
MSLDCRPDRLAMQKVVGSSPIIRSTKGPGTALRWLQRFIDERLRHSPKLRSLRRRSPSFGTATEILVFRR